MSEIKEQQHAPRRRPWEIYDFGGAVKDYPKTIIVAPTGESICEISGGWPRCTLAENEANAKLIVRAVNSHQALVEVARLASTIDVIGSVVNAEIRDAAVRALAALAEKES